ncbi:hypothetical protein JNUCC24_19485 (plasmid) [Bacillus sp. JNUCC-24]|uniref:hypothetical protein n=1 Tax=Bacillus sp. JNUCC-24 TaxID=2842458 RepID=UPI001C0B63C8|nr:hypothetical protein [Bacillus sp. JNUCC-24]QWS52483.1 hypothetical protein JNUCC24_19485 [Bacillus sp. JNUCC-24]
MQKWMTVIDYFLLMAIYFLQKWMTVIVFAHGHLFFAKMDDSHRLFFAHAAIYFLQKRMTVIDYFLLMRPFIFCKNG